MKRGLFISFEGIDGCGKSTQLLKLVKYLFDVDKYNHCFLTREPYKDRDIRKILQADNNTYDSGEKLAELFVNDRKEHIEKLIIPKLKQGIHVITDRYSFSTLAYQQTQGVDLNKLLKMHKGLIIPDIIFIIDVPSKIAVERIKKDKNERAKKHKFEKNPGFLEKLRKIYLDLSNLKNHNVIVIDGTKNPDEIFEQQIKPAFDKLYQASFS